MLQRVITAIFLAIPALLALGLKTSWPLAVLGLVAAVIGGSEADRLLKTRYPLCAAVSLLFYAPFALSFVYTAPPKEEMGLIALLLCAATCFGIAAAAVPDQFRLASLVRPFAGLWVAAPLLCVLLLHFVGTVPALALNWIISLALFSMLPVWAGDIAAIFAGRAFGKHLLAPKISPKKTVEGSVANLVAAVVVAAFLGGLLHQDRAVMAGCAVGILGQIGDLFESYLKRRVDLKDSGTLLPGHGGVLDRIDSVLFTAPAVALILLS